MAIAVAMLLRPRTLRQRLGNNTDVVDSRNAQRVDDGCKNSKGNGLVASQEHRLLSAPELRVNFRAELVNIHRVVPEVDVLPLVDADDQAVLTDILHRFGFGDVDFNAGLQNGRGD